jgi:hypothetical protein
MKPPARIEAVYVTLCEARLRGSLAYNFLRAIFKGGNHG